ncbi:MAG: NAD(P)-dependent oxidoreductase [Anaerolineae bacterium]|nr:NAD(P)-dependent oxidoreductase [Anaerolineae bacterium]MCA9908337.1 NAD(P)-dependent oxidoreductase [Anaerolineae bacterium]
MEEIAASSGSLSVFVNGGTTPLGRALVRRLVTAGHRVTATVSDSVEAGLLRQDGALPSYPDLTRAGELRSAVAASKSTVFVNLAPTYPNQPPQGVSDWDTGLQLVSKGTTAAIEAAKATDVEFFIQGSFSFLGGDEHDHGEHEPPTAPFIDEARLAEERVEQSGLNACILRFGFVYSAESPALQALRQALLRGRRVMLGSTHTRANWIQAEDGAQALALAIAQRPVGETLYIVDDQPATPADFVRTLADALGVSVPAQLPALAQRVFASETQLALLEQPSGASNVEAKERLGWTLQYPTMARGLDRALLTWRALEPIRA